MSFQLVLALFVMLSHIEAQLKYCRVASTGPCISGLCPSPSDECIITASGELCCNKAQIGIGTPASTVDPNTDCQDLLHPRTGRSDCPNLKAYCNVPAYYNLMTQQCPKTCGRCKEAATASPGCQDLVNPKTGRSDCYKLIYYCNYPGYVELMKQQCPKTCRYCN